jgi:hypothetical protein
MIGGSLPLRCELVMKRPTTCHVPTKFSRKSAVASDIRPAYVIKYAAQSRSASPPLTFDKAENSLRSLTVTSFDNPHTGIATG